MAVAAIAVGFMAGLFGIGGGLISVPVLFYIFESLGLSSDYIMHLAVGTSFSIIVPTSISSVLTTITESIFSTPCLFCSKLALFPIKFLFQSINVLIIFLH